MKTITIEELIENLEKDENRDVVLVLEGNIEQKINMKIAEVNIDRGYMEIVYDKSRQYTLGKSLKINIHQIKKIESDEDIDFFIHLDGEQKVIIFTDDMDYCHYNISRMGKR